MGALEFYGPGRDLLARIARSLLPNRIYAGAWYGLHWTEHGGKPTLSRHHYELSPRPFGRLVGSATDHIEGKEHVECRIRGFVDERRMLLDVERNDHKGHHKVEVYYHVTAREMKGYILGKNFDDRMFVTHILVRRTLPSEEDLRTHLSDETRALAQYPWPRAG